MCRFRRQFLLPQFVYPDQNLKRFAVLGSTYESILKKIANKKYLFIIKGLLKFPIGFVLFVQLSIAEASKK